MAKPIELFMWRYQPHFRIAADIAGKRLLEQCDAGLEPEVFLVGLLGVPRADRQPICIEPEANILVGGGALTPGHLAGLAEAARAAPEPGARARKEYSHPLAEERAREDRRRGAMAAAIKGRLDEIGAREDALHFCALPTRVDAHDVAVVLRVKRSVYESHRHLRGRYPEALVVPRSLLDAAIGAFLDEQATRLQRPDPGAELGSRARPPEELLREAGRSFALGVGLLTGGGEGAWGLFDACTAISAMLYEGAETRGELVLCQTPHAAVDFRIDFLSPVPLQEHRTVRKLLESTREDLCLVSDASLVRGIGVLAAARYAGASEDLFRVRFVKQHCWDLLHAGDHMMRVVNGWPELPRPSGLEPRFREVFAGVFAGSEAACAERIWGMIDRARGLSRGSTIVVVQGAEEEAARLSGQSITIRPVEGTPELVAAVAAVDGAILLDPEGKCHAFGVILDGTATGKGDRARGSRYNSAVRYQQSTKRASLVVVVSDDGMVDVLPEA